jgi:hypothetical protein
MEEKQQKSRGMVSKTHLILVILQIQHCFFKAKAMKIKGDNLLIWESRLDHGFTLQENQLCVHDLQS